MAPFWNHCFCGLNFSALPSYSLQDPLFCIDCYKDWWVHHTNEKFLQLLFHWKTLGSLYALSLFDIFLHVFHSLRWAPPVWRSGPICYFQELWHGLSAALPGFHWGQLEWHYEGKGVTTTCYFCPFWQYLVVKVLNTIPHQAFHFSSCEQLW